MRAARVRAALATLALGGGALGGGVGCSLVSLDGLSEGPSGSGGSAAASTSTSTSTSQASTGTSTATSTSASGGGGPATGSSSSSTGEGGHGGGGQGGGASTSSGTGGGDSVCPDPPILDDFNRPDGPLGAAWLTADPFQVLDGTAYNVNDGGYVFTTWSTGFNVTQVGRVTLSKIDPTAREQLLLLKVQGNANIEVLYSPTQLALEVWTCTGGCDLRANVPALVRPGAVLAARADAGGGVTVCLDGEVKMQVDVSDWAPYYANPGRIGIGTFGDVAGMEASFDDFGAASEP